MSYGGGDWNTVHLVRYGVAGQSSDVLRGYPGEGDRGETNLTH